MNSGVRCPDFPSENIIFKAFNLNYQNHLILERYSCEREPYERYHVLSRISYSPESMLRNIFQAVKYPKSMVEFITEKSWRNQWWFGSSKPTLQRQDTMCPVLCCMSPIMPVLEKWDEKDPNFAMALGSSKEYPRLQRWATPDMHAWDAQFRHFLEHGAVHKSVSRFFTHASHGLLNFRNETEYVFACMLQAPLEMRLDVSSNAYTCVSFRSWIRKKVLNLELSGVSGSLYQVTCNSWATASRDKSYFSAACSMTASTDATSE